MPRLTSLRPILPAYVFQTISSRKIEVDQATVVAVDGEAMASSVAAEITNVAIAVVVSAKLTIRIALVVAVLVTRVAAVQDVIPLVKAIITVRTSMSRRQMAGRRHSRFVPSSFRQQRGRGNTIPAFNRRNVSSDKPTATVNH